MDLGKEAIAILSGIIVLAIIAVLVSNSSQTGTVIQDTFGGLATAIKAAVSPVSGNSFSPNVGLLGGQSLGN